MCRADRAFPAFTCWYGFCLQPSGPCRCSGKRRWRGWEGGHRYRLRPRLWGAASSWWHRCPRAKCHLPSWRLCATSYPPLLPAAPRWHLPVTEPRAAGRPLPPASTALVTLRLPARCPPSWVSAVTRKHATPRVTGPSAPTAPPALSQVWAPGDPPLGVRPAVPTSCGAAGPAAVPGRLSSACPAVVLLPGSG